MERIVQPDGTEWDKWTNYSSVTAENLGACSVAAVFNTHGFLLFNISPDVRKYHTPAKMCEQYSELRGSLFCNKPVKLWILHEETNREYGSETRAALQGIGAGQIFRQRYSGESFTRGSGDNDGAKFSLALVAGSVMATMQRQDGKGPVVQLSGDNSIVTCPESKE